MSVAALVPAAGSGQRLGPGDPKALRLLAGEPLLVHAVRALRAAPSVGQVVVAAPDGQIAAVARLLAAYDVTVVTGGQDRGTSVRHALERVDPRARYVLVHDAARPLVSPALVEAVVAALRRGAAAVVPVLPVADTVKRVVGDRVVETVDRADLRVVQTPQGFQHELLVRAYDGAVPATDDAALVEALGSSVTTVAGSEEALKVTRPFDLLVAEAVLARRAGG